MPANAPDVVRAAWQALGRSDTVGGIGLGGSRATGCATKLSEWDLYLKGEPASLMAELPGLVARYGRWHRSGSRCRGRPAT